MTQEFKELLLQDLCARLPYRVKCNVGEEIPYTLSIIEIDEVNGHLCDFIEKKNDLVIQVYLSEVKPYLFPLSSMTEEERNEYKHFVAFSGNPTSSANFIDWLNAHHFDYRGLIPMGLALDATNLNIY